MREFPDFGFKVKEEVLEEFPEYQALLDVMEEEGFDLDEVASMESSGFGDEDEEQRVLEAMTKFQKAFEAKYPGFSISTMYIPEEAEGDVSESFWYLENVIKPEALKLSDSVTWTTFG